MRIGIDVRVLNEGKTTGVEVYTRALIEALFAADQENLYLLFNNSFRGSKLHLRLPLNARIHAFLYPNRLLNLAFTFLFWPRIDQLLGGVDVFFSPRYLFGAWSGKCKLIITTHDLSFVHQPEFFSWQRRLWHSVLSDRRAAERADLILAVSESTKKDLVNLSNLLPTKIRVVYPGLDHARFNSTSDAGERTKLGIHFGLPKDYILILATVEPRKNIYGVIEAFERLCLDGNLDLDLVIAGGLGWLYQSTIKRIKRSPASGRIKLLTSIGEDYKPALYRGAKVFVFPSFYEGFGFPPLEAQACGIPVVASMNSSFPEVLGDAALYVNPFNHDQIYRALKNVLDDATLRAELVRRGVRNASRFSWEKTAKQVLAAFEHVMS